VKSNVTEKQIEAILEVYELEEILDHNDLSIADAVYALVDEGYIELPEVKPISWDDTNTPLIEHSDDYGN
jgi:hypothetical protein